jgi:hypothetical protein
MNVLRKLIIISHLPTFSIDPSRCGVYLTSQNDKEFLLQPFGTERKMGAWFF